MKTLPLAYLLLSLLLLSACTEPAVNPQTIRQEASFTGSVLEVTTAPERGGNITISRSSTNSISIVMTGEVGSSNEADAIALKEGVEADLPFAQDGDTVRINDRNRYPLDPSRQQTLALNYDVRVPIGTRVIINSARGRAEIRDINGNVTINEAGSVALSNLGGNVTVNNSRGSIEANVSVASGRQWNLNSSSSSVSAVTITVPSGAAFEVDAITRGSGRINTTALGTRFTPRGIPSDTRLEGRIGTPFPGTRLTVRSEGGGITFR